MEIRIEREKMYKSPLRNSRFAWKWIYTTTGPDGVRFSNDSIVTLRQLLRRRYPYIIVVEPWNT